MDTRKKRRGRKKSLNIFSRNYQTIIFLKSLCSLNETDSESIEHFIKETILKLDPQIIYFVIPQILTCLVKSKNAFLERFLVSACKSSFKMTIKTVCYLRAMASDLTSDDYKSFVKNLSEKIATNALEENPSHSTEPKISVKNKNVDFSKTHKTQRLDALLAIFSRLQKIPEYLAKSNEKQGDTLKKAISQINSDFSLFFPFYFPLLSEDETVVKFSAKRSIQLGSSSRAPFMFFLEVVNITNSQKRLFPCIYKNDVNFRQELLALQLIEVFGDIWKNAELPLRITAYEILPLSQYGGLVEVAPDAKSIDQIKKNHKNFTTLSNYFTDRWGSNGSEKLMKARRNFVQSMAAYSIVTYLLQVKDRHNGNILIDTSGNVIHIDFGFFLSNSPGGNVNFESVPFKLTAEQIQVMKGDGAEDLFDLFKFLVIRGFLEVRKHWDSISAIVRMMDLPESRLPCFSKGASSVSRLVERLCIQKTDEECIEYITLLIEESYENWRTEQYDSYQRIMNGIL